ncbi:MAG: hypothetical protein CENE_02450 [Candidatus Celerinatantimonas neptuna]|nr:MAG: hypothetical protein CENE_02450 [Candidatus Celerinatantimonas neptuna]
MQNSGIKEPVEVPEQDIRYLDHLMKNIDADLAVSMAYVKRTQGLTFSQLQKRFSGINVNTMKRYMQPSYPSMRPLHFLAAYSWVTMVPITSFYYKILYPNMDSSLLKVLMCVGKLPSNQFNAVLEILYNLLNESSQKNFLYLKEKLDIQYDSTHQDPYSFPPSPLDIQKFAVDYYYSVAVTAKKFRENNNISIETISRVVGLSQYQYQILEDTDKSVPFPASIGARIKLGFKMESHAGFTSEMQLFPEFHKLRCVQNTRNILIMELFKLIPPYCKPRIAEILTSLSNIY